MPISAIGASVFGALLPKAADGVGKAMSAANTAAIKAPEFQAKLQATLDAMRDKGIDPWPKEEPLEKRKEEIGAQILQARGTSEADPEGAQGPAIIHIRV